MNKLVLSPNATKELAEIKNYIRKELKNPTAANRIVGKITKSLRILEHYPEAGPAIGSITGEDTDIRMLVCDKYIALYRIMGNTVYVARIINAKQDYLRILFGDQFE